MSAVLKRELLMLVPSLPPTPRVLKLCQYLPSFGWRPCLLAPDRPTRSDWRYGSLPEEAYVETTPFLRSLSERLRRRTRTGEPAPALPPAGADRAPGRLAQLIRLGLLWTETPDKTIGWVPFALSRGRRLLRERPIRAVFSTGPPFTTLVAGASLARRHRLPFVADFRDAWTLDPLDPIGTVGGSFRAPSSALRLRLLRSLEARTLRQADIALFTSRFTLERYTEAFPFLQERGMLLLNGVDEGDFEAPAQTLDGFTFTCIGTFHEFQWPQVQLLLEAFASARRRDARFAGARILLGGIHEGRFLERLEARVAQLGLQESVRLEGVMSHARAVALMKGAGALLLFAGQDLFTRLTKVSDCMVIARPALALAAVEGETGRCVAAMGGVVFSGDSPDALTTCLLEMAGQGLPGPYVEHSFPFRYPHPLHWKTAVESLVRRLDTRSAR